MGTRKAGAVDTCTRLTPTIAVNKRGAAMQSTETGPKTRPDLVEQARRRADLTESVEATMLRDLADTLVSEREAINQILREETALLRHKYRGAMSAKGRAQQDIEEAKAALVAERDRADRAEAKVAEAWDEGAEYGGGYSITAPYDNPYRSGATA